MIRWQRQHAHRRAQRSSSGIGVAVVRCRPDDWGRPRYTCLATDGTTRRYLEVRAPDLRWGETIVPEALESEIERFAGRLPEPRLHRLVNANPLHVARDGGVAD